MKLKNKSAVLTGAGKGIGRATAIELAKQGVHLGLISRSEAELSALCKELTDQYGIQAFYAVGDISIRLEAEAAADSVIKQLGKVDILINNAGIVKFGTHPILSIIRQISLLFEQQTSCPTVKIIDYRTACFRF